MSPRLSRRLLLLPLAIAAALSSGCATGSSEPPPPCVRLPLVVYSPDTRNQVADEIEAAPPGAAWPAMIADYGTLRAAGQAAEAACERAQ